MANTFLSVRSGSKCPFARSVHEVLTFMGSYRVESWITDDAGRKMQKHVWESLSKRLNDIQPGCI